jgi:hypothetical protein
MYVRTAPSDQAVPASHRLLEGYASLLVASRYFDRYLLLDEFFLNTARSQDPDERHQVAALDVQLYAKAHSRYRSV